MRRFALLSLTLLSCNRWVRPDPQPAVTRQPDSQSASAVRIEMTCDPFEDGGKLSVGSGVMVSEWQVLTALHVVDCQSAIADIHVTTTAGRRYRFSPEREWVITSLAQRDGVARIQMASGDSLRPRFPPPTVRETLVTFYEPLYIQTAEPTHEEKIAEATGWEYGGASYGGTTFTYKAPTVPGNSGSGIYDIDGQLVGVHLGTKGEDLRYGAIVTPDMVPHP